MGEILWSIFISFRHRWIQLLGCGLDRPFGWRNGPFATGAELFGSSTVVWYVMCPDSLNWALWGRFHGRYWYQSFIDESNICGVDRVDPWGPEMDHPPLGRSYLVVVPSYDMSCALILLMGEIPWSILILILLTGLYGWDSMVDIDIIIHRWVQYLGCG